MATVRKLISGRLVAAARSFSSNSHLSTAYQLEKISCPAMETRPALGPEFDALRAKERGPWTKLSKEDKVALYRAQFSNTLAEAGAGAQDAKSVLFGILVGLSCSLIFFAFLKKYVGPEPPHTITPEWRKAQEEKMKLYRMNPVQGLSSK